LSCLTDFLLHLERDGGIDIIQAHTAPPSFAFSQIIVESAEFEYQRPHACEYGSTVPRGSAVRKNRVRDED
jgi:hypothetical protein